MPSEPTQINLGALIEQPESGRIASGEALSITMIYKASYAVCKDAVKAVGTVGTGDLEGFVIRTSVCEREPGSMGRLVDVWEAGGPDADPETTPLPPDEFSLASQELNPPVEKHPVFNDVFTDTGTYTGEDKTLVQLCREAGLLLDEDLAKESYKILQVLVETNPMAPVFEFALALANLLRRGTTNYYQASFVYQWSQYSYTEPALSAGGFTEDPTGPLADGITGLGLSCLRQADDLEWTGSVYRLTKRWICAPGGDYWEPLLYAP